MSSFSDHQKHYLENHTTYGCKITHMFGVPLIAASLPLMFFDWRLGIALFVVGWILQFIGHYMFEKNKPVLMSDPKNPFTYVSALIFAFDEWRRLFTGRFAVNESTSAPASSDQPSI